VTSRVAADERQRAEHAERDSDGTPLHQSPNVASFRHVELSKY